MTLQRRTMKDCTELWCVIAWHDGAEECDIVLCSRGLPVLPIMVSRATRTLTVFSDEPQSITIPLPDLGTQTHVAARFDGPSGIHPGRGITLEIDSKPLVSLLLSAALEPGFLTDVILGEPIDPSSFGIWTEAETAGDVTLLLDSHLAMSGLLTAQHHPTLSLHIAGWTEVIPVAVAPLDNGTTANRTEHAQWQIDAPLPGWIWRAAHLDAETVELTVRDGGRTLDILSVSREEVVGIIETMAREVAPGTASISELCALEHVVYGDLLNRLAPEAQSFVRGVAQIYGVEGFLAVPLTESGVTPPITPVRVEEEMMALAVAEGADLARSPAPGRVGALQRIVRDFGLLGHRDRIRDFLLQLTESYILAGSFDNLAELAQLYSGVYPPHDGVDTWTATASLPHLVRQGELERVSQTIWSLDPNKGWLVTPAIAYAVSEATAMPFSEPSKVEAVKTLTYGYMNLLRKMKSSYWGRAQCSTLLECSVNLVQQAASRPDYFRQDVERFVLEVHGLSSEFWDRMARHGSHSLRINTASRYFRRIREALDQPDQGNRTGLIDALRHFMEYAPDDALRFARELLPQDRLADCLSGTITGLRPRVGADLGEFIRVAAHPAFNEDASLFRDELRRALLNCSDNQAHSNAPQLITRATRALFDLAAARTPREAETSPNDVLPKAIADLTACGENSKAAELATLLVALHLSSKEPEAAARILSYARQLTEIGSQGHAQFGRSAGMQAALTCLRTAGRSGSSYAEYVAQDPAFAGPPEEVARTPANLVFDTVVTIISCRKYLEARKALIDSSYVIRLKELGIPYVYVVGGDRTYLDGDVLQVECPDDYEFLPEKILATVEWVQRNTQHAFMLKIDDDCFLNADEFFFGHSWRSADYYGRRVHRSVGDMDRMWHMAKSFTRRAQLELDKSPEPSIYADGGSGYTLSRRAMVAILRELQTSRGALLKNSCYMEDKLIGDLLGLSGITLVSTDYHVPVFRELAKTTIAVSMYSNSFLASRVWPAKLVHLDHSRLFEVAQRQAEEETLRPAKIWPSYAPVRTGANSNALDLVTDSRKAQTLLHHDHAVVSCVRNEMEMLPQFLDHHRRLGVTSFLISDNCSTDGSVAYLLEQPDVVVFSCDTAYREATYGVAWQQALLSAFRCGRWSIVVDADEFLVPPGPEGRPIADFLAEIELEGADAALALLVDMYPSGELSACDLSRGDPFEVAPYVDRTPLRPVWFHGPYSNSPAWTSSVRHRQFPNAGPSDFTSQKTCLLKYAPWMQLSAGLHYVGDCRIAEKPAMLCHFKYHAGFHAKVLEEVQRKQHFEGAAEYVKYLEAIQAGRALYDPRISVPWREAPIIQQALAGQMSVAWPDTRLDPKELAATRGGDRLLEVTRYE